jgi:hypothetical protein
MSARSNRIEISKASRRPYTFVVTSMMIVILGIIAEDDDLSTPRKPWNLKCYLGCGITLLIR